MTDYKDNWVSAASVGVPTPLWVFPLDTYQALWVWRSGKNSSSHCRFWEMGETIFWKRSSTQNIQFLSSKAETQRKPFYFGLTPSSSPHQLSSCRGWRSWWAITKDTARSTDPPEECYNRNAACVSSPHRVNRGPTASRGPESSEEFKPHALLQKESKKTMCHPCLAIPHSVLPHFPYIFFL